MQDGSAGVAVEPVDAGLVVSVVAIDDRQERTGVDDDRRAHEPNSSPRIAS